MKKIGKKIGKMQMPLHRKARKKTTKRRRKIGNWPDLFEQANFTLVSYETTTLVLGVIVATSGDAGTKLRCHRALQGLRRLRKLVKGY